MVREYVLNTGDSEKWRRFLPAESCVMGSLEYVRILEQQSGFAARLFVVESGERVIAYPFFIRPVDALPFASHRFGSWWDTFTPEYTGPFYVGSQGRKGGLDEFNFTERFAQYCRGNRIVAEFAHLSPWHASENYLAPGCVVANRPIVHVDLTLGETGLWNRSLNSDTRRHTRQAERAGVRVRWAESLDDVREFHRLYAKTMERRHALERYRFPFEYFAAIFGSMTSSSFFALAEYRGQVIAGGLFFHDSSDVYWHLSAADMEFSCVRPVNKFVWDTILWAAEVGKQRMLFGGGYRENDGIFRFKAGFSPLRVQFCTYQRVHDNQAYKLLTGSWSEYYGVGSPPTGFFPEYRSLPPDPLEVSVAACG